MAVLEMRGGTHLLLFPAESAPTPGQTAPFDLMVDDIDATRRDWEAQGLAPTAMTSAPGNHHVFTVEDPDGHVLTVFSTHVMGEV